MSSPRILSSLKLVLVVFVILTQIGVSLTAAGRKVQYIIYPGTSAQNKKYLFDLQSLVGPDNVKEYGTITTGILFWLAHLDSSQALDFSRSNKDAVVHKNEPIVERKTWNTSNPETIALSDPILRNTSSLLRTGIAYQKDPPDDLKVVSWPPGKQFKDLNYFAYDREGGKDVVLYLVEEGVNLQNAEFAFTPTEWLYGPLVQSTKTDDDPISHGSCVASKAVGTHLGLSKGTRLVVLKSTIDESDVLWALGTVLDQMARNGGSRRKSVVLFAYGSKQTFNPNGRFTLPEPWIRIRKILWAIIRLDGIVVVPSGNSRVGAFRENTDILPALYTRAAFGNMPLTLVGSCDSNGVLAPFSQQSSYITAWAPGIDVQCAKSGDVERDSGTSISAGMVAGLAAYFLGNTTPPFQVGGGLTARRFNDFVKSKASWRRSNVGVPNMLYNLQDGTKMFPVRAQNNASITPDVAVS